MPRTVMNTESLFFSSRRRHTRLQGDWSSDVCSSDLAPKAIPLTVPRAAQLGAAQSRRGSGASLGYRGALARAPAHGSPAPGASAAPHPEEIGRASCREKSVDLGGRRIIKKKKEHHAR